MLNSFFTRVTRHQSAKAARQVRTIVNTKGGGPLFFKYGNAKWMIQTSGIAQVENNAGQSFQMIFVRDVFILLPIVSGQPRAKRVVL